MRPIILGTRKSPLALKQADIVKTALHTQGHNDIEIKTYQTSGDRLTDAPLSEYGGKGLFTKEIEEALLYKEIDIAVHSMKDVETHPPEKLIISCIPVRENPSDVLLSKENYTLENLPLGATVGTSSLRRQALLLHLRPDLKIVPLRGNVGTRIQKIQEGFADATVLAYAGLSRLNQLKDVIPLDIDVFTPALAQGALGVQCRQDDTFILETLSHIHDKKAGFCTEVERTFLRAVDGSCRAPIGGLARYINEDEISFIGFVSDPQGKQFLREKITSPTSHILEDVQILGKILRKWLEMHL
ncbi:MAG: hydroxymethylbilane synthase [Caedibacter sp. 38-128]|nr:hydroxymethylbilane synthase [Holosporales bacterium]OJX03489.1 MAG: hydroxymethylbilane synthase [Caedibacter sp. 38-128]